MVTPPRTGKFVYASSSRLVEFLAIMPNMVKQAMVEKFSQDKEVYETMHRLFGLENILAALKPSSPVSVVRKPAIEIITGGTGLSNDAIKSILEKGYALRGENTTTRVAVLANDADQIGPLRQISGVDIGSDYEVVTKAGEIRSAFTPKRLSVTAQKPALLRDYGSCHKTDPVFMIFADGNYSLTSQFVVRGEAHHGKKVMTDYFSMIEPLTPRTLSRQHNTVAVFTPDLDLVAAGWVDSVVEAPHGITIQIGSRLPGPRTVTINAYRNCQKIDVTNPENIFVPINTLIAPLGSDVSNDLEVNVNAALAKLELNTLTTLGSAADIGFDGIEFTFNGKVVGPEMKLVERLVVQEGIAPHKADSFIKQAKDSGRVKIYLSKKADYEPGEIPQFGELPPDQDQYNSFGADKDGAFSKNLKSAVDTQDPQMVESMVISELLQATDMTSLVKEYLPEIQAAIDKLGRTLFLARLNMDKLSMSQNSNEVMSFIANLRNVYRLLGDNATKLERMVSGPEEAQVEAGSAQ
jgi:hypothetical protein